METKKRHPLDPPSNVPKLAGYDPNNYLLDDRMPMVSLTDESLTPGRPPCLTQRTIGKYLQPLTRELTMVPPRPTIHELPDTVKDQMVLRDKAFWVDKPGANAYTLHDAYYDYQMTSEVVKPVHQDVFPRSYQYDLDCVRYRRTHGCDGLKQSKDEKKIPLKAYCRDCKNKKDRGLTPFQLAWAVDPGQRRWRDYPDVSATLTANEIRASMDEYAFTVKEYKAFRTCVCIKSPSCDPLELCDDDSGTSRVGPDDSPFVKSFNSGKSCLFSLKQADISSAMSKFEIKVSVHKELPCGCLPTKINLGEATIDMTKEFVQARKNFLADPNNVSYQALKDSFHIKGADGVETGEILMFLRISCFGKLIVTRFKGSSGPPTLGSGMGGSEIVDRSCNPPRSAQSRDDPCACGASRGADGGAEAGSSRRAAGGVCDPARDPYNSMPCEDPDDPCYCTGPKAPAKQKMECRNTEQYCLHVPKDCCPPGNKVVFQMPQDTCGLNHRQRAHFSLTSDGVGDMSRDDPAQLTPTTAEDYPGVVYDFSNRVIKLKIAKTVEGAGRKSKLEYQFITPVPTHDRVVPVQDNRGAQCLPTRRYCCSPCHSCCR